MGVGLTVFASAPRSGLWRKAVQPDELAARIAEWANAYLADELLSGTQVFPERDGSATVLLDVHRGAEEIRVQVLPGGEVEASANTGSGGPGYHAHVCGVLKKLGEGVGLNWKEDGDRFDETGYFSSGDMKRLEKEMLTWIGAVCRSVLENVPESGTAMLSMPMLPMFEFPGASILTPMGPRTREWVKEGAKDPGMARDFFAWWTVDENAAAFRGRALASMWIDVRWAAPESEHEEALLRRIAGWLARAHELDPTLEQPWREWAEILGYLGAEEGPAGAAVRRRAEAVPANEARIGYRRGEVVWPLPGGWRLRLPGKFAQDFDENGEPVWFAERRTVRFSSVAVEAPDGSRPSAEELLNGLKLGAPDMRELARWHQGAGAGALLCAGKEGADEEEGERYWAVQAQFATKGVLGYCTIAV